MANRRIRMEKIKEIIRLGEELRFSNRAIARALKVSRPVVAQYLSDFRPRPKKKLKTKAVNF